MGNFIGVNLIDANGALGIDLGDDGVEYIIAIDGYFGESGDFVFGGSLEETSHLLAVFLEEPQSLTVRRPGFAVPPDSA
ncbi:MAG: hypothetical protein MUE94_10925 [Verrucomicrobia bacterium]|jgi:hypothetical protein|nr:hypothetical protein [Verrucomicrobiota bacterium]